MYGISDMPACQLPISLYQPWTVSFEEGFVLLNGHQDLGGRVTTKLYTTLCHLIFFNFFELLKSKKSNCLTCVGCHIDYPGFTGIRLVTLPGIFKMLSNHLPELHALWKCPYWVQQVLHSWEEIYKEIYTYRAEKKPLVMGKELYLSGCIFRNSNCSWFS